MKVAAVMPAYFEEPRIAEAVLGVFPYVDAVIVVDDGSEDGTAEQARTTEATVLRHSLNRGQGAALRTGTEAALALGADIIVHIDAAGQHDPEAIASLTKPILSGHADIVFGSRFLGMEAEGMPVTRKALLMAARQFNALVLGVSRKVSDPQSGFRAMSADAARLIDFQQDRMAHCSEILRLVTRSGLRWQEVPTRIRYTEDTLAKGQKPTDAFKIVWQLIIGAFH